MRRRDYRPLESWQARLMGLTPAELDFFDKVGLVPSKVLGKRVSAEFLGKNGQPQKLVRKTIVNGCRKVSSPTGEYLELHVAPSEISPGIMVLGIHHYPTAPPQIFVSYEEDSTEVKCLRPIQSYKIGW